MERALRCFGLILVVVAASAATGGSLRLARPALAFSKNNPRWEFNERRPPHPFHKPYKPLRQPPDRIPERQHGARHASRFVDGDIVLTLAGLLVLGVVAPWMAHVLRLPPTLLPLVVGFVVGPAAGLVDPDTLFGYLLLPMVSLCLAVILFTTALRFRFTELRATLRITGRLMSLGIVIMWLASAAAAYLLLGFGVALALFFGAALLTGTPWVSTSPQTEIAVIADFERVGLGVMGIPLAVLAFGAAFAATANQHTAAAIAGMLGALAAGVVIGGGTALLFVELLRRRYIPVHLERLALAMLPIGTFAMANVVQADAGFWAAIAAGVWLANQRTLSVVQLTEGKDLANTFLAPCLLVVLAARFDFSELAQVNLASTACFVCATLAIRFASVAASTVRAPLTWRQRLVLSWLTPKGAVCAAVATVFGLRLVEFGDPQAALVAPLSLVCVLASSAAATVASLIPTGAAVPLDAPDAASGTQPLGVASLRRQSTEALPR